MALSAPCKDCRDRKLLCHGTCQRYQEYKVQAEDLKRKRYQYWDSFPVLSRELRQKMNKLSRGR